MKRSTTFVFALLAVLGLAASTASAGEIDPALKVKVDAQVKIVQSWASDPAIVQAVKAQNASPSADVKAMTEAKWASLAPFDAFVLSLASNPVGQFLKGKKGQVISEAFVSAADGAKVGYLAKTTSWIHKGKAKHDVPMSGKIWYGEVETDKSTGLQQVQVGVPVLDGGQVIGSVVVGFQVSRLGK